MAGLHQLLMDVITAYDAIFGGEQKKPAITKRDFYQKVYMIL